MKADLARIAGRIKSLEIDYHTALAGRVDRIEEGLRS